jgi:hypothetical protein
MLLSIVSLGVVNREKKLGEKLGIRMKSAIYDLHRSIAILFWAILYEMPFLTARKTYWRTSSCLAWRSIVIVVEVLMVRLRATVGPTS